MELRKKIIVLFTLLIGASYSYAGGMEGGGGVGVRCGDKLEMLEVHESHLMRLELVATPNSEKEAINISSKIVGEQSWLPLFQSKEELVEFLKDAVIRPMFTGQPFLMSDIDGQATTGSIEYVTDLPFSNDVGNYRINPGCKLEQIAYFSDGDKSLKIVKSSWDKLDWLSRMVLIGHEAIYSGDRDMKNLRDLKLEQKPKTSEWTRYFISKLFSLQGLLANSEGLPESNYQECTGIQNDNGDTYTHFYIYKTESGSTAIFDFIAGRSESYQIKSNFKDLDLGQQTFTSRAEIIYSGAGVPSEFEIEITKSNGADTVLKLFEVKNGVSRLATTALPFTCN